MVKIRTKKKSSLKRGLLIKGILVSILLVGAVLVIFRENENITNF
jgi:hypothetical protein